MDRSSSYEGGVLGFRSRTVQTPPFYLAPEPGNSTCFDAIACRSDSYLRAPKFDFARLWGRHLAARQFGVYSEKAGPNSQNCALSHDFHPEVCVLASDPRAAVDGVNAWCRFKQPSGGGAVNGCFQPEAVQACGPTPMGLRLYFQKRTSCQTRMDARAGFTTLFAGLRL